MGWFLISVSSCVDGGRLGPCLFEEPRQVKLSTALTSVETPIRLCLCVVGRPTLGASALHFADWPLRIALCKKCDANRIIRERRAVLQVIDHPEGGQLSAQPVLDLM